ncbi:MAG: hypothetical protein KKD29_00710 [Candidatus Omnitrophica bacterium]|nr:hypothetical protein [Candidatus Omnitrophota bacterium]MBU4488226.1 hypothetical protein [Candidatus Omnitrophota bacterium]MCG2705501.1 hypothetical protein [Candidatus Omnitrophota bacterium]
MSAKNELKKHHSGFMLLEVMLSVFVVTVGVVFVIGSFTTSIKASKVSKIYVNALYLLEQSLWEYEEKGKIEDGRYSGKFDDYKGTEWEIEAKELEDIPLLETEAGVVITKDDQKRYFKISTYFFKEE